MYRYTWYAHLSGLRYTRGSIIGSTLSWVTKKPETINKMKNMPGTMSTAIDLLGVTAPPNSPRPVPSTTISRDKKKYCTK